LDEQGIGAQQAVTFDRRFRRFLVTDPPTLAGMEGVHAHLGLGHGGVCLLITGN
jgi:hypothetical protein